MDPMDPGAVGGGGASSDPYHGQANFVKVKFSNKPAERQEPPDAPVLSQVECNYPEGRPRHGFVSETKKRKSDDYYQEAQDIASSMAEAQTHTDIVNNCKSFRVKLAAAGAPPANIEAAVLSYAESMRAALARKEAAARSVLAADAAFEAAMAEPGEIESVSSAELERRKPHIHTPKPKYGAPDFVKAVFATTDPPDPKADPPLVRWCVTSPESQKLKLYWDGDRCHRMPFAAVVNEGAHLHDVVAHGPGWIHTQAGKGKMGVIVAEGCVGRRSVGAYRWERREYPKWSGMVFVPHLNTIRKCVPMDRVVAQSVKAIYRLGSANYSGYDFLIPIILDTTKYYVATCRFQSCNIDSALAMFEQGEARSDSCYQPLPCHVAALCGEVTGEHIKVDHVEAKLSFDWATRLRDDMTFTRFRGAAMWPVKDKGPRLPTFFTEPQPRGHRSKYFSFNGATQGPFIQYAKTSCNLRHGLKRMVGARAGEFWYRKQARKLARRIANFSPSAFHPFQSKMLSKRSQKFMEKFYSHSSVAFHANLEDGDNGGVFDDQIMCPLSDELTSEEIDAMFDFTSGAMQTLVYRTGRTLVQKICDSMANSAHWAYYTGFEAILTLGASMWSRDFCAQIPHVKKKLREAYVNGVLLQDTSDIMVRRLNGCVKAELAKFGKAPRLFVSYDAGCMYANELPEFVKVCLNGSHTFAVRGISCTVNIFAKPKTAVLVHAMRSLIEATGIHNHMYALIFSDDVVYAGARASSTGMESFCFNGDIASNDASQDACAFLSAFLLMSRFHTGQAMGLVEQCTMPMVFENPENRHESFSIKCDVPFEGSGTVLTTILNHCASFLISLNFAFVLAARPEWPVSVCYTSAAGYAGHCVTMDDCTSNGIVVAERIQFLKRSPMWGTTPNGESNWFPVKNSGCVLRSLGTMEGDMEPKHIGLTQSEFWFLSEQEKAERFFGGVVQGDRNEPTDPVMQALRERFPTGAVHYHRDISAADVVLEHADLAQVVISEDSWLRRYGITSSQLNELLEVIRHVRVGMHSRTHAAAAAFCVDYGVDDDYSPAVEAQPPGGQGAV
jgi:hypothetical protein